MGKHKAPSNKRFAGMSKSKQFLIQNRKMVQSKIKEHQQKKEAKEAQLQRKKKQIEQFNLPKYVRDGVVSADQEETLKNQYKLLIEKKRNKKLGREETSDDEMDGDDNNNVIIGSEDDLKNEKTDQIKLLDHILEKHDTYSRNKSQNMKTVAIDNSDDMNDNIKGGFHSSADDPSLDLQNQTNKKENESNTIISNEDGAIKLLDPKTGKAIELNYLSKLQSNLKDSFKLEIPNEPKKIEKEEEEEEYVETNKKEIDDRDIIRRRKGKPIKMFIRCEYIGTLEYGRQDILARAVVLDEEGKTIYDSYVKPSKRITITDYRTEVTGLNANIISESGIELQEVRKQVLEITKKNIIIGYGLLQDMEFLKLQLHPSRLIRDISFYNPVIKKQIIELNETLEEYASKIQISDTASANKLLSSGLSTIQKAQLIIQLYKTYEEEYETYYSDNRLNDFFYLSNLRTDIKTKKKKKKEIESFGKKKNDIERNKKLKDAVEHNLDSLLMELKYRNIKK